MALLKACAVLIALSMMSTLFVDPRDSESVARAAAVSGVFSPPVRVNDNQANDQGAPVIVSIPGRELFVVWQDSRAGLSNKNIYSSGSFDNGTTYAPNKRVDDSVGSLELTEPAAAVSGNGTILVVWQDNRRNWIDRDVFFSRSYDGGATFTKNMKVDDSNMSYLSWQERPSIAVTLGGTIFVAWTDDRLVPGHYLRIRGAYSNDGGATFSPSIEIAPSEASNQQDVAVVVANNNRIFVAFMDSISGAPHPYLCISTNGGKSFSAPTRLDSTGSSGVRQQSITIAPMPGGGLVAAWEDSRNGAWDIYASIVSSSGKILTPDIKVDDDVTGSNEGAPSIASDQLGNIYVAWMDGKDGASTSVRFAYMAAGNTTFNKSVEIAKPGGTDMQRMPSIISPEPGRVSAVWQDDKGGTYDVYSSTAYFPDLFGLSFLSGWNFISIPTVGYVYNASTLGLLKGDAVVGWNSETQKYDRTYVVGMSPVWCDFSLCDSTGYWIHINAHERVKLKGSVPTAKQSRSIDVPDGGGWAMFGFESLNVSRYASDIPKMLNRSDIISSISCYYPAAMTYKTYVPGNPATDFVMVPGQACWIYLRASATIAYSP